MLRLVGFLILVLAGSGGLLFLDFNRTVQQASATDQAPPSFRAYLESLPEKVVSLTADPQSWAPKRALADLLPPAPEGWTARKVDPKDIAGFLPKGRGDGEPETVDLVKAVGGTRAAKGAEVAIQAYEKGERRIVVQLVRYPDDIFTGLKAIDQRHDLQMWSATQRGRPMLTVRGLDVTEEFLGDGFRARYFTASVGAQVQIRVLASKRLKDADLAAFFAALDVKALNERVVDAVPGLGEIPVIVLASAMSDEDRAAYEADRAARAIEAATRANRIREEARAELAALESQTATEKAPVVAKPGFASDCKKGEGGIKRCSVAPDG